jgi:CheY-like chemotaxis protein/HPt (histidine-containing phosphotransfer) domain-containing protein
MNNRPRMPTSKPVRNGRESPAGEPVNTIRMDSTRLEQFLHDRDVQTAQPDANPRRGFVRIPYRNVAVSLSLSHPGGTCTTFMVACRNLSSGGMGLLHCAYVHTGTRCRVELRETSGKARAVEGAVVRCAHVKGTIHEVGVKFDAPIDPRSFIELDPFSDRFSLESVDPETLRGVVLYIEDSTLDQAMVRHFFRQTQVQLVLASTLEEGLARAAAGGVDLILCNNNLGDVDGAGAIQRLRGVGVQAPILILTADAGPEVRAKLISAEADAFLMKPLQQNTLFRALAEFLTLNSGGAGFGSSLPEDHPNLGLLDTFVKEMLSYATQIEAALAAADHARAGVLCLQIAGSAPVMGFQKLADLANAARASLARSSACADSAVPLRALIAACQRSGGRAAAA